MGEGRWSPARPVGRRCLLAACVATVVLRQLYSKGVESGLCAMQPPPRSAPLARAPSTSFDQPPLMGASVSILPEVVERPLGRYLHYFDDEFNRPVPRYDRQYKTVEQQYLYKGDFALFIREATPDGVIVQDSVSGIFGFVPKEEFGVDYPVEGQLLEGCRCIAMDNTIIQSQSIEILRLQTGVVFEWDEEAGEGYILPSAGQMHKKMIRVLRRDVDWHGSYKLHVGQFVQFETVKPEEVPIEPNDEPMSLFALRVRSPEVVFSLYRSYEKRGNEKIGGTTIDEGFAFPVESGRPAISQVSHPLLEQFRDENPIGRVASPAWAWDREIVAYEDDGEHPIVPIQFELLRRNSPYKSIAVHEEAVKRNEAWKEPHMRKGIELYKRQMPLRQREMEKMGIEAEKRRVQRVAEKRRQAKERVASRMRWSY